MSLLSYGWSILTITTKRLQAQYGLALTMLLGLVFALALTISIPLYADAIYYRLLQEELANQSSEGGPANHPPYAFMFNYLGSGQDRPTWEAVQQADAYLSNSAQRDLGLPQEFIVRYFKTDPYQLFAADGTAYGAGQALTWLNLGFVSGIEEHITLVEGDLPWSDNPSPDEPLPVLVGESLATELGLQTGESYLVFIPDEASGTNLQIPIRITALWRATGPADPFWFYRPADLENLLLISEAHFQHVLAPQLDHPVYLGLWYLVMDGSQVRADDATPLLSRIRLVRQRVSTLLPNTTLGLSPVGPLSKYRAAANLLTVLLFVFSVPILMLTLAFIGLVVSFLVDHQRNEIAVLRSRGATEWQIIGLGLLEGLVLCSIALLLSLPVGTWLAQLIGQTRTFLDFSANDHLSIALTQLTINLGLLAAGLGLVAQVTPTLSAAQHTIISYKQEQARVLRRPWWQRAWLDVLLLLPVLYGVYLLQRQGQVLLPGAGGLQFEDSFQNPLLFLLPAVTVFALTLFALRFVPTCMALLAWLISRTGSTSLVLALRQLGRSPGFYTTPLLLVAVTLSLSAFTASLARTLDQQLHDQVYYQLGADLKLTDFDEASRGSLPNSQSATNAASSSTGSTLGWFFFPYEDYLQAPGVEAVTRVGRYQGAVQIGATRPEITFIGLDRVNFAQVAFWRYDFARESLGGLMNDLAGAPNAILVPRQFMIRHALTVGDTLPVRLTLPDGELNSLMVIAGSFDLFPTWYPDQSPLLVGNLDYLFQQVGGQQPYQIWFRTDPTVDPGETEVGIRALNAHTRLWPMPAAQISAEQSHPARQGLFGVLSVGFLGASVLTIIGFCLYMVFSFRRRYVELGTLRAIGLSMSQMGLLIFWELSLLILIGGGIGTGLGALVSYRFIPYLQLDTEIIGQTPPFLVEINWPAIYQIYGLFAIFFLAALVIVLLLLRQMKIFQAVKLGETV